MAENKRGKISQLPYLEEIEGGESLVGAADGKGFQVTIDTLKGYVGSGGSGGGSSVDLTNVKTNIIPVNNDKQSLGIKDKRWGMLHVDSIQLGTNVSTVISIGTDLDRVELSAHLRAYSSQGMFSDVMTRSDMGEYAKVGQIPTDYASKSELTQAITNLKGGASGAYDTLKEIENILEKNKGEIGSLLTVIDEYSSKFQGQIDGLWSRNSFEELILGHAAADTIASEAVYTDKLDATDVYINGKRAIYTNTNNNSVIGAFDVIELSSFRTNNIISLSNTLTLDFGGSDSYKMILDRANASIYGVGSIALGKNNAPWSSVYATTIYEGGQSLASKYMPHMKILDYVGKDSTNPVSGGAIYNEFQKYVTLTSLNDRLANVASFGQFLNINNGKITIGTDTITPLTEHQTIYPLTLKTSSGDIKYEPNKESSGTGYSFVINKESVGLGNVENKSSATIRGEITSSNVTNALGYTPTSLTENDLINKGFVLSTALDNYLLIGSKASSAAVFGNGNWGNYITAAANTGMVRYGLVTKDNAGSLPSTGNANGVLTLNTHGSDGTYKGAHAQFAFNSSGLFYRYTSGKELNSTDAWDTIATQSWVSGRYDGNIASLESRIGGKQDAFNVNDKHFTLSKKSSTDAYPTLEIKLGTYIEVDDDGIAFRATSFEQDYLAQYAKVNGYTASRLIGADANGRLVSTGYATSLLANIQNLTSDAQAQINTLNNRVNGIISGGVVNGAYSFRKSLTSSEKGLVTVSSSVATVNDVNGIVYHDYEKCFLMLSSVSDFIGGRTVTGFKRWTNSEKFNAYTYDGSTIKTCVAREDTLFYNSSVGLQRFVDGVLKTIVSIGDLPASFVSAYSTSEIDLKVANINGQLTKASLKSTLGISDWALATSKPTYTISQIQDVADVAVTGHYDSLSGKPDIPLVNNSLTSTSTADALSAAKGKELNDKFADYLPLSGGIMTSGAGVFNGSDSNTTYGAIGFNTDHNAFGSPVFPTKIRSSVNPTCMIGYAEYTLIHSGNYEEYTVHINEFEGALKRLTNVENIAGNNKSSIEDLWPEFDAVRFYTIPSLQGQINGLWARNSFDELYATHVMSDTLAVEEMFTDKLTIGNAPIEYVVHEGLKLSTAIYIDGSSVALSNQLPTTTQKNNWTTAYNWGNHASAGYASLKTVDGHTFLKVTGGVESEDGWALRIGTDYFMSNVQSAVYADYSSASVYLGTPNYRWLSVYALSYDQSSDATLKDVVGDTSLTLSQIANAPAVSFTWKYNGKKDVGTLAQYWKDVLPEIVSGEEGNMGMNYAALGVVSSIILARNVETHEQRIERLERENEELRKEILTLKNR